MKPSFAPSEALFRAVIDNAHDVFALLDANGAVLYISEAVRHYGHKPWLVLGRSIWEMFHPEEVDGIHQVFLDLVERPRAKVSFEHRAWNLAGIWRTKETTLTNLLEEPTVRAIVAVAHDVTERKQAEAKLRQAHEQLEQRVRERTAELEQSEARYRRLIEGLDVDYLFYSQDSQGQIQYVSPSIRRVLGYDPDEIRRTGFRPHFTDNPLNESLEASYQAALDGQPPCHHQCELRHADGTTRILEYMDVPVFDSQGHVIAIEGIARDITDRKRAEEALQKLNDELDQRVVERTQELAAEIQRRKEAEEEIRQSEERFRSVVEDQTEFIVRWVADGVRTFVNGSYCRFFGKSADELIGESFFPAIPDPEDRERIRKFAAALTPESPLMQYEHRVVRAGGSVAWVQWVDRALFDSQGNLAGYQSVGRDITAEREASERLRRLEDELAHVGRLSVMGEMVATMAHEIGQPLHVIQMFAETTQRALQTGSEDGVPNAIDWAGKIQEQANRAGEIIKRLRGFTSLTDSNRQPLDIGRAVRESLELVQSDLRKRQVHVETRVPADLPPVLADRIQVEQVLVNLLRNAGEALEDVPPRERRIVVESTPVRDQVQISVCDRGCGLGEDTVEQMFDAFYTTKSHGTGIGLAICQRIVQEHGGRMWAEPNENQGMTFLFTLPKADAV